MTREERYIFYRKVKGVRDSLVFYLMRIFPIKHKKITICTFEGKGGYGCNPRYIVEELHRRDSEYQFVWLVNDLEKEFPDYIQKKKNSLWSRAYHLSTSKVWIDNYRKPLGTKKRKKQLYLQTWHGTICFKALGMWRGEGFSKIAHLVSKRDADMTDYVLIDSEWCREVYPKGLVYEGEFMKTGMPRCDIMVNSREEQKRKIREKFGLPMNAKIVMFAPTFREKGQKGKRGVFVEETTLDFEKMTEALNQRFGGEWYIFMRLHPQFAGQLERYPIGQVKEHIVDVSTEPDMCELLAAVDAIVTDYSSAAMDASYIAIPVFLYADDLEDYMDNRGGMFWNLSVDSKKPITSNRIMTPGIDTVLPFPLAVNNEQMQENILRFNEQEYLQGLKQMQKDVQLLNDGFASKRVADFIEKWNSSS